MRILVVEDEKRLARTIGDLLEAHNYTVDLCYDGESGLDNALSGIYDIMVLDVMLPKLDGFSVAREVKQSGTALPILMLTARSEIDDKVTGLDSGADYYLTKPFASEELLACIRALTRKSGTALDNTLSFGDLRLELSTCQLSCGERSVRLSRKEFDVMTMLLTNGGQVVTKEALILKVWGYESDAEDNNVEVYISFLRKKLGHIKSAVSIRTLRMLGYQLEMGQDK
ncbi:MAG: response regulator transcription factor [Oscillospiraceae bacterium]|nr:response regulator transcription factor [Oscillospiraceae bacterium]